MAIPLFFCFSAYASNSCELALRNIEKYRAAFQLSLSQKKKRIWNESYMVWTFLNSAEWGRTSLRIYRI
jgi:hypothetical protein